MAEMDIPDEHLFLGNYAAADFLDAEESRPSMASDTALISLADGNGRLSQAVENLIRLHTQEIQGSTEIYLTAPGTNSTTQVRRKLREFFFRYQQTLFQFLENPAPSVPVLSAYNIIMKRFGRPDFSINTATLKDLTVDIRGETVLPELNTILGFSLETFTPQVGKFLMALKDVTDEIMLAESSLRVKVEDLEKLTKNVQSILTLNSGNSAYDSMIKSTEAYIVEAIRENAVEESYKALITGYKKLALLQEAFMGLRLAGSAVATEPLCSVCITEAVQYTFSPCGHTFCQGCMRKQNMQCFICRQVIRERIKLYFS